MQDVGEQLLDDAARAPPPVRTTGSLTSGTSSSSKAAAMANPTPSTAARARSARVVAECSPVQPPRSSGVATPPRSPARNGRNTTPPAPGGAVVAAWNSSSEVSPSTPRTHSQAEPPFCRAAIAYQPSTASAYPCTTGASAGRGTQPGRSSWAPVPRLICAASAVPAARSASGVSAPPTTTGTSPMGSAAVPTTSVAGRTSREQRRVEPPGRDGGGGPALVHDVPQQGRGGVAAVGDRSGRREWPGGRPWAAARPPPARRRRVRAAPARRGSGRSCPERAGWPARPDRPTGGPASGPARRRPAGRATARPAAGRFRRRPRARRRASDRRCPGPGPDGRAARG